MKRLAVLLLAPLALAACGQAEQQPSKSPVGFTPPPRPAEPPPTYVGRWAASPELCESGAWVFEPDSLVTAGEVSCTFSEVTPTDTGWIAEGACIAQAPASPASLVLNTSRPDARRTLAVSGGPFAGPVLLTACPTEARAAAAAAVLKEAAAIDRRIQTLAGSSPAVQLRPFVWDLVPMQAWVDNGQLSRIAEPVLDAGGARVGERLYWFREDQPDPFLIRQGDNRYAFDDDGRIVAVFSREGTELQLPTAADRGVLERRLIERARALRLAAEG